MNPNVSDPAISLRQNGGKEQTQDAGASGAPSNERDTEIMANLDIMTRLHDFSTRLVNAGDFQAHLEEILSATIEMQQADFGNVQLFDVHNQSLRIVAQRGFEQDFLTHVQNIPATEDTAYGRALRQRQRVIIEDIEKDPGATPSRSIAASAGYRAVQSTPLFGHGGQVLGILSTHFRHPHRPSPSELRVTDLYVRFAAQLLERKQAETTTARLAAIVASSQDAIIGCTPDGTITDWNAGAEELFGYAADEITGRNIGLLVPPELHDEHLELFERLLRGERLPVFDTMRQRKSGTRVEVEIQISPLSDADGHVIGVSAIARDITKRKRLEQTQHDFLAMASHDLRSPITVLRGRAQMMRRRHAYDEHGIDVILEQTHRMGRLVSDLHDLVHLESGTLRLTLATVDLADIVGSAADRARFQAPLHTIRLEMPEDRIAGHWDAERLGQILDNLLANALNYSSDDEDITVRLQAGDNEACLSVADRGPGIPAGALSHLFDRFYRVDQLGMPAGLGLGLYITRMLVEAHGGRIRVDSEVGNGSTFMVTLPYTQP